MKYNPKTLTITLPGQSKFTEELIHQLDNVLEFSPPLEIRNTLIELYHSYIYHHHDSLPITFRKMADQMWLLSDFFMNANKHINEVEEDQNREASNDKSNSLTILNMDLVLLLASEELKSYKFFSVLRSVGLDDAFYQTNLVNFLLKELDLDEESNLVLDTYFLLLDEHSKDMRARNESVRECALKFCEALVKFRDEMRYVHSNS